MLYSIHVSGVILMKDFSKYLGIRWKDGGRDFNGCDCWGLLRLFLKEEYGVEVDSFDHIRAGEVSMIREMAEIEKQKWVKVDGPGRPGDGVEIPMTKNDWHVGVIPVEGYVLHISDGGFSEMTRETDIRMRHRIKSYFRHQQMPPRV